MMADMALEAIIGAVMLGLGIYSIARRRFALSFGGNGIDLHFTLILRESRAIMFGAMSILGGVCILLPIVAMWVSKNAIVESETMLRIGFGLFIGGYITTMVFELIYTARIKRGLK
jgi:hypothetical protein